MPEFEKGVASPLFRSPENKVALTIPEKDQMTFGMLTKLVLGIDRSLASVGIEAGAPVAAILPRGPTAWVSFLGISLRCACVPIPSWTPGSRIGRIYKETGVRAVITDEANLEEVSRSLPQHMALLTLDLDGRKVHVIRSADINTQQNNLPAGTALLVGTSGSTGSPKLVPLSHSNILSAAHAIAKFFSLNDASSCANLMPFFHVHGLISAGMSTLVSGGELVALDGVHAKQVISSGVLSRATWVTGVPALYHGLLGELETSGKDWAKPSFIRVASAPLDPTLRARLEDRFGCRVVESYGLSETASLIASQDPRLKNRSGSGVGIPVGADIQIWDDSQTKRPTNVSGRVVIRGPSVCHQYLDGTKTTMKGSWLDTGDIGHFSADGCLHIDGRIKHMINRAGETIAPRDIEHACLDVIPCSRAIAWGVAHPTLGEQPVVAIETELYAPLSIVDEIRYRTHLLERLPVSHMPVAIFPIAELPCNDVGKLDLSNTQEFIRSTPMQRLEREVEAASLIAIENTLIELHPNSRDLIDPSLNYHLASKSSEELRLWCQNIKNTFELQEFSFSDLFRTESVRSLSYLISVLQRNPHEHNILASGRA